MAESKPSSSPAPVPAAVAATATPADLPPAGDARRDEMKRRLDQLNADRAQFEADFAGEIGAIDPAKLDPKNVDREIAVHFDPSSKMLEVTDARPDRVYFWEQADPGGRFGNVWVLSRKATGWKVIDSKDREARDKMAVDGTRRVGDAILMWIERERYEQLMIADRRRRIARKEGLSVELLERAERAGVQIHDLTNPQTPRARELFARAQAAAGDAARATMVSTMRQAGRGGATRAMASEIANRRVEDALRAGTIPGLQPGK